MKSFLHILLLVAVLPFAAGCTASVFGGSTAMEQQKSMAEASYAAADMLIQQSKILVTSETALQIGVLSDMDNPAEATAFGRVVTGQIGARFVQLGYNVSSGLPGGGMAGAMDGDAAYGATYDAASMDSGMGAPVAGPVLIAGQYALAKKTVMINLRLTEIQTGRVLAAYDYSMPLNSDIKQLSKTAADKNSFFGL